MSRASEGRRRTTGLAGIVVSVAILLGAESAVAQVPPEVAFEIRSVDTVVLDKMITVRLKLVSNEPRSGPLRLNEFQFYPACSLTFMPCVKPDLQANRVSPFAVGDAGCPGHFPIRPTIYTFLFSSPNGTVLRPGVPCEIAFSYFLARWPPVPVPVQTYAVGQVIFDHIKVTGLKTLSVQSSPTAIQGDLMTTIEAMNLPDGAQASLTDPLDAACNKMDTFAKRVLGSRELTQPQLDQLLIEGQEIQDRLGC